MFDYFTFILASAGIGIFCIYVILAFIELGKTILKALGVIR